MRLLAISGSLRARSSNGEVLAAIAGLAPEGVEVDTVSAAFLAALPAFNPDDDGENATPPEAVAVWRDTVGGAAGLIVSSPEYAHGVPGALKNALDWLVSSPVVIDKPVALINASPRSKFAHAQLAETLRTMSTRVIEAATIELPISRGLDARAILEDRKLAEPLAVALQALIDAVA
ncbi:MAG: NAD(P)H-dependent oxidoreductase [Deltaproteobacteria bacterium]|nr:NAD(P)H-dependent oxidoreductase [Deltaproteobacteria bacterium]